MLRGFYTNFTSMSFEEKKEILKFAIVERLLYVLSSIRSYYMILDGEQISR
jgi:hypothetical protein